MHSRVAQFVRSRDLVFALLPVGPFFSAAITRQIGPSLQSRPFCMARAQNMALKNYYGISIDMTRGAGQFC